MDIAAAAAFLGVSVKTVERYIKSKKIAVTLIDNKRDFNHEELIRFKEQKEQPIYRPALATTDDDSKNSILFGDNEIHPSAIEYIGSLANSVETLANYIHFEIDYYQLAEIQCLKLFSLQQAAKISGCSVYFLKSQLKSGNLQARKIGKSWKILPEELDRFIKSLFI